MLWRIVTTAAITVTIVVLVIAYHVSCQPFMHDHERSVREAMLGLNSNRVEDRLRAVKEIGYQTCSRWAAEDLLREHLNDPDDRVSIGCAVLLNEVDHEVADPEAIATFERVLTQQKVSANPDLLNYLRPSMMSILPATRELTLSFFEGTKAENIDTRNHAVHLLTAYGDRPTTVPLLIQLLLDPAYNDTTELRSSLLPADYESDLLSDQEICELLDSDNSFATEAVLSMLVTGSKPPPDGCSARLIEIAKGEHVGLSKSAIKALGKYLNAPREVVDLARCLLSSHGYGADEKAMMLINGTGGPGSGLGEQALPLLPDMLVFVQNAREGKVTGTDPAGWIRAIGNMGQPAAEALPFLLESFDPTDARKASALAFTAARVGKSGRSLVPMLVQALQVNDLDTRLEVAQALTALESGLPEVRTAGLGLLGSNSWDCRAAAAEILAANGFNDPEVLEMMQHAWRDTRGSEKGRILAALEKVRPVEATQE